MECVLGSDGNCEKYMLHKLKGRNLVEKKIRCRWDVIKMDITQEVRGGIGLF